jgi:hypothetical protein
MNFNQLRNILSKVGSNGSTLKSYISEIQKNKVNLWNFEHLEIKIEDAGAQNSNYSFKSYAKRSGDWVLLNEQYHFDSPEAAFAEVTKQVLQVISNDEIKTIIGRIQVPTATRFNEAWNTSWGVLNPSRFLGR